MNVLKKNEKEEVLTLLRAGLSARKIHERMGYDRDTVAKYAREAGLWPPATAPDISKPATPGQVATGSGPARDENPPPRPPDGSAASATLPARRASEHARSACEPHRDWIEEQVRLGRNGQAIFQDLVDRFGFKHRYNSVKRFVRGLKHIDPEQFDILEYPPGEESQVDYGQGAPTLCPKTGKYRTPRLFVMTLKYSRRAFRKVVWNSSQEVWARLHEEAFRYFGGCTQYVVLDNLKEGVLKPDIYDPGLNPLYAAVLAHCGCVADPARVRDPNRKGTVESAIQHTQSTALKGRKFESIEEQNEFLMHWEERWAAPRIHGRMKRQVEEMFQEEKPFLKSLPLTSFRYFKQEVRTVWDDGCVQIGQSYYGANPFRVRSQVVVRIYDLEIEILDPKTLQVVRRHVRKHRPGSFSTEERDRVFNPSRETDRFLEQAHQIGPFTEKLCRLFFEQSGRLANRSIRGVLSLARRYEASRIEEACRTAVERHARSSRYVRVLLEKREQQAPQATAPSLVQTHELIRPGSEYAAFWDQMTDQPELKLKRN